MAVQTSYTEARLLTDLQRLKSQGKTLRAISAKYPGTTFGDIQRALKGQFPKSCTKRLALHLPALAPAPVCIYCAKVHVSTRCPGRRKKERDLFSLPVKKLKAMIQNREPI